ncbi:hypothetical protein [Aestuariibacter salexigens]|uniref:hypothetical protein n=1 Tax=Aestuariibacter salexigens TaxID=226010 RepID=UPI000407A754|nr:hypothetical protein [Aestuariibacter salexigens]
MSESQIALLTLWFCALVFLLLGAFFRTPSSHGFINGRENISDINAYANSVGNCLITTGIIILTIAMAFYVEVIGLIGLAVGVVLGGTLPIPWIIRTHLKFTSSN